MSIGALPKIYKSIVAREMLALLMRCCNSAQQLVCQGERLVIILTCRNVLQHLDVRVDSCAIERPAGRGEVTSVVNLSAPLRPPSGRSSAPIPCQTSAYPSRWRAYGPVAGYYLGARSRTTIK
jgi:hypothetical protein